VNPSTGPLTVVLQYLRLHNDGVTSGDFHALGALFARDAVLQFHGVPIGPFRGRRAIVDAFTRHPPVAHLVMLEPIEVSPTGSTVSYADKAEPSRALGSLWVEHDGEHIQHLVITVGP
jgi:hypothetical protein